MLRMTSCALMAALALTGAHAAYAQGERRGSSDDPAAFTFLNDEGFPLNVDPEIVAAAVADLDDGDIIMGIVLNGEARAYPVNYMNGPYNEVVNDELGGQAIAPSW